ncbi:CdvA-like protein, partial [Candidatus Bathyarchaeota archaeon]|nr:CdvA-like protein [Candidatus Bathyarchaeota archaeon]
LKSGEISENIYKLLLDELSGNLSLSVEQIFKARETLEILRAKAKIEWAREKIGIRQIEERIDEISRNIFREDLYYREVYSPIHRWQEIVNRIDEALSSLTFEEELSLIERYLSIVRERASPSKEIEEAKMICQQRLSALSDKWASMRRDKIGKIMDLELQASQIRDDIKEVEVRFAVGEIDRNIYESKISVLQSSLRKMEKEISEIRNYIDDIDLKIFRSSELLREI